jgi:hypothetical protein
MEYNDLDTAKSNLKTSKKKLNNGMKTLVKDNLDKFIAAKDEVDKLTEKGSRINEKSVDVIEAVYQRKTIEMLCLNISRITRIFYQFIHAADYTKKASRRDK